MFVLVKPTMRKIKRKEYSKQNAQYQYSELAIAIKSILSTAGIGDNKYIVIFRFVGVIPIRKATEHIVKMIFL